PTMPGTQEYDRVYLRSTAGLCKLACLLCSFLGFLCIACGPVRLSNFRGSFYLVVVSVGFAVIAGLLLSKYLRLWEQQGCRCDPILWSLVIHSVLAFGYFTASGLVLSLDTGAYTAASFFGLTVFSINALEAYSDFRRSRQREVATQTI
ncbi:hypothetical protein KR018_009139, partial [Drosophila ironensis]